MSELPRTLPGGLELRWATPEDAEELAAFNVRIHTDVGGPPEEWLGTWTRNLCSGDHPTTTAADFTVVRAEGGKGPIVSSLCLISQTWAYAGIEFGCGRPELVGTDPDYRRQGLVDLQMDVIHGLSEERGELVQAITGIPWLYRKYGYDMGLDLGGGRRLFWEKPGNAKTVTEERLRLRDATVDDIGLLADLYAIAEPRCMVTAVRNETVWRYLLRTGGRDNPIAPHISIVTTIQGEPVGYVSHLYQGTSVAIREIAVVPGASLREVALFVTRRLRTEARDAVAAGRKKPLDHMVFQGGEEHLVYDALGRQLESPYPPYAWYIRVPDISKFLTRIAPVLERRLAESVMAGHTGKLRLGFYDRRIALNFKDGRLEEIGTFTPKEYEDGDALFPVHTFLSVVFGRRTPEELRHILADCYTKSAEAEILLGILFPKQPSHGAGLN